MLIIYNQFFPHIINIHCSRAQFVSDTALNGNK